MARNWQRLSPRWQVTAVLLMRAGLQTGSMLVLAHGLTAAPYGSFIAALAMASIWTPLAGLGTATEALRLSNSTEQRIRATARPLLRRALGGSLLTALAVAGAGYWLRPEAVEWPLLLAFIASELLCAPILDLVARLHQAMGSLDRMLLSQLAVPVIRFAAIFAWFLAPGAAEPFSAALAYLLATITALLLVLGSLRPAGADGHLAEPGLPGLPVAVGATCSRITTEIDKPLLATYASTATAGCFNLFSRTVELALLPVVARLESEARLYYQLGASDPRAQRAYARASALRALPALLVLGLLGAMLCALILPRVLGPSYSELTHMAPWVLVLVVPSALRQYLVLLAQGQGRLHALAGLQILAAGTGFMANAVLIPAHGWPGAVLALLGAELMLILGCATLLYRTTPEGR